MITEKLFKYLYIIIALAYVSGLFIPLMENDSAQHATMSMRIYLSDDFFNLQRGNEAYLDKPHMHFWLSALSFNLFGLTEWAYRLPSFLFTILGAFSVFKLTKEIYKKEIIAHFATVIFLSSQTIFLANHDVRTDAVLTGATIFAIWQLYRYIITEKSIAVILGAIGLGISFSTKGLYGPMIIFFAIISQMILMKKLKILLSYKTILGFLFFALTISPVIYAYYLQFGQEGVEFILWKQNVDRATATNLVPSNTDYFFFFHSILWLFFPWSLLMYFGLFKVIQKWIKNKLKPIKMVETMTIIGVFAPLLILSFSQFKLPHYVNPLIPLLSIMTAHFIYNWYENNKVKTLKTFLVINYVLIPILIVAVFSLLYFVFEPVANVFEIFTVIIALVLLGWMIYRKNEIHLKFIIVSVLMMVFVNTAMNLYFYPKLLEYQAGLQLSRTIKERNIDSSKLRMVDRGHSWTLDFYTQTNTPAISKEELEDLSEDLWVYVDKDENYNLIKNSKVQIMDSIEVNHFRVSKLNMKFIKPSTRASKLRKAYLLNIKSKN